MASKAEKAAYKREWRKRNPEKARLAAKRWQAKNPRKEYYREWKRKNPEKVARNQKKQWLKRYGLTVDRYDELVVRGCALCGAKKNPCIDHDHDTGRVRGILCSRCNIMIGHYERIKWLDLWDQIEEYLDDAAR